MTQLVTIDRTTLEQLIHGVEMGFDFDDGDVFGVRSNDMTDALAEGYAALANAEPTQSKHYAWRNPMNGVVISNDKKERLLCVGRGYPNFSEPLYVAGAKP